MTTNTPNTVTPKKAHLTEAKTAIPGIHLNFRKREVHIATLGPGAAETLLQLNVRNRAASALNVERLATDMRDGAFRFTGESICFDTDGTLLNGQHRLLAIIESGCHIEVVIVTGVGAEAQGNMDAGKKRSLADTLQLNGEKYWDTLAAILGAVQVWENGERLVGSGSSRRDITNDTSLRFLAEHPELRDITAYAVKLTTGKDRIIGLTSMQVGVLTWAFDKLNAEDRIDFFEKLQSGANLHDGHPILTLKNFLARDAKSNQKVSVHYRNAVTVKAWNAYRDSADIRHLRFAPGGAKPERFPEPM